MAVGIKAFRKIQLGRETVPGTAVAATTIWRGLGVPRDDRKAVLVDENIGMLSPSQRLYIPKIEVGADFDEVEATFEQLPHIFEAGLKSVGSGAADGAGSDKIYDYPFPLTTAPTIKTYTIEGGDNVLCEKLEYAFVSEFTISGKVGEALKMSATWVGRQLTPTTFTGALSLPVVEEILFSKGKLSIDNVAGTFGTTQVVGSFLEMALKVKTGLMAYFTGDGNLYFTAMKNTPVEALLDITFEVETTPVAERANWRNLVERLVQVKFEGSSVASGGTTYQKKTLIVNLAGKWDVLNEIGDSDEDDTLSGTFRAGYSATKALMGNIIVVNELSTVP